MDIKTQVLKIVATQIGKEVSEISSKSSITDDLQMDSLDTVEIIMSIEEQFNISVPDEQAEKLKTIDDLVHYIEKNKKS